MFCWQCKRKELDVAIDSAVFINYVTDDILTMKRNQNNVTLENKLAHWLLMGGLLYLVQRGEAPPRCTKYNSPPINGQSIITVLL